MDNPTTVWRYLGQLFLPDKLTFFIHKIPGIVLVTNLMIVSEISDSDSIFLEEYPVGWIFREKII